jgi:arginase
MLLRQAVINQFLTGKLMFSYAKHITTIVRIYENVAATIEQTLKEGHYPFILSGDHSSAGGTIAGIRNMWPDKKIGVIWIDAHADLHTPFTTPSGNLHGMPLAASLGVDNQDDQINNPTQFELDEWEKLKHAGSLKICPKIAPRDLLYIDIRDMEQQEWDIIHRMGIKYFSPPKRKELGIANIVEETIRYFQDYDYVYVSFDVDSLDVNVSQGTGTPVPGGLSVDDAMYLWKNFFNWKKTIAFEVTEINPLLDNENLMAESVLEIIRQALHEEN